MGAYMVLPGRNTTFFDITSLTVHYPSRRLNAKRRLVWVGRYVGGKASGVCWSFISGGGAVVGKVDSKGKLTGDEVNFSDATDVL